METSSIEYVVKSMSATSGSWRERGIQSFKIYIKVSLIVPFDNLKVYIEWSCTKFNKHLFKMTARQLKKLVKWNNLFKVSSQLVTWPTRNQVNPYPGSQLVTILEKSTRNQSLGYELTFQKLLRKTQDIYDYIYILFYIQRPVYVPRIVVFILCIKCTTRWSKF